MFSSISLPRPDGRRDWVAVILRRSFGSSTVYRRFSGRQISFRARSPNSAGHWRSVPSPVSDIRSTRCSAGYWRVGTPWSRVNAVQIFGSNRAKMVLRRVCKARLRNQCDLSAQPRRPPFDGASNYTVHFDKEQTPPAEAFWSIALVDCFV